MEFGPQCEPKFALDAAQIGPDLIIIIYFQCNPYFVFNMSKFVRWCTGLSDWSFRKKKCCSNLLCELTKYQAKSFVENKSYEAFALYFAATFCLPCDFATELDIAAEEQHEALLAQRESPVAAFDSVPQAVFQLVLIR